MKMMIRVHNLRISGAGAKSLSSMEKHGKRLDSTAKKRHVREVKPLFWRTLDLAKAYKKHIKGCEQSKAVKTPILHALIKFPDRVEITKENELWMIKKSVEFINSTHGGDAVFAARLDRDEKGQRVVDVFYAPKYTKKTKHRKTKKPIYTEWTSTTKYGKLLCEKHRDEIISRNEKGKFSTAPRSCGIALQAELTEFMTGCGLELTPRQLKTTILPDRLEIDDYKRASDLKRESKALEDKKAAFDARVIDFKKREREHERDQEAFKIKKQALALETAETAEKQSLLIKETLLLEDTRRLQNRLMDDRENAISKRENYLEFVEDKITSLSLKIAKKLGVNKPLLDILRYIRSVPAPVPAPALDVEPEPEPDDGSDDFTMS